MLSKQQRLAKAELDRLKGGDTTSTSLFNAKACADTLSTREFKAAIIVPIKNVKNHVARNKLRRQVYSALRQIKNKNPEHIKIFYKNNMGILPKYSIIKNEIEKICGKQ